MSFMPTISVPRARVSAHRRLLVALLAHAGEDCVITSTSTKPWASALFQGARHLIDIGFAGKDAVERADAAEQRLPEADFAIDGHIVADLSIDGRRDDCESTAGPFVLLRLSVLTIEDW